MNARSVPDARFRLEFGTGTSEAPGNQLFFCLYYRHFNPSFFSRFHRFFFVICNTAHLAV